MDTDPSLSCERKHIKLAKEADFFGYFTYLDVFVFKPLLDV